MAIFGWLALAVVLGYCSLAYGLAFLNNMGTYNIGGVPNSPRKRAVTFAVGLLIAFLWYKMIVNIPISITIQ